MTSEIVLTWRNFPGIVDKGMIAAEEGREVWECPYDLHTPQHHAWIRGYCRIKVIMVEQERWERANQ